MLQHPGRALQLQGFCTGVHFPAFVARLLPHATDTVVARGMMVGALAIVPPSQDDHVVRRVCAALLQRLGQKGVGLLGRLVDQTPATRAGLWLADTSGKATRKRLVAWSKQREFGGDLHQEHPVFLRLLPEGSLGTDEAILLVPEAGGLRWLA
jgi:hypothetical protein